MRRELVTAGRSLNGTCPQNLQRKEQPARQLQTQQLSLCHLKLDKLVAAVRQPVWYVIIVFLNKLWLLSIFLIYICLETSL